MPSGSYLALSYGVPTEQATAAHDQYAETGAVPYQLRTPDELRSFFDGLEFVEPGFGPVPLWRPEPGAGPHPGMVVAHSGTTTQRGPMAPAGSGSTV